MIRLAIRATVFDGTAKPDSGARAGVRLDLVVQPEHVAGGVEQRPARVAGVDRRVGLDRAGDRVVVRRGDAPADRADDAGRRGPRQAERAADRHHRVTDLRGRGVGQRDRMQLGGGDVHADHGHVGRRVGADHLRRGRLAVLELDRHLGRLVDDVLVGEDVAGLVIDDAGALALRLLGAAAPPNRPPNSRQALGSARSR